MESKRKIEIELKEGESHLSRRVIAEKPDGSSISHGLAVVSLTSGGKMKIEPFRKEIPDTLYHDYPLYVSLATLKLYELR